MDATASTAGWLHTDGGTIRDASEAPYVVKSASWFGLETPECAPHGLWSINLDDGVRHIKTMGFNTIRLPYSNECITEGVSRSIDYSKNPALQDRTPLQIMDAVVTAAGAAGLNVILDRHRPDSAAQSELWYTSTISEEQWIADWKMLVGRYRDDPTMIGVDLHNEPRGTACWGCGNAATDWRAAATRAGNAVLSVNPRLLVIVEGIENEADGSATWWGSGLRGVATQPVTLDTAHRVVYSPHDYPASVYPQQWFTDDAYPSNLTSVWDRNWGYIAEQGIAPVLLGEFGSKLETESDRQWLEQMVAYLDRTGISYSYWSYNPNSGDTGGLVRDDWRTEESEKTLALKPLLAPPARPTPLPVATPVPAPSPTPTPLGARRASTPLVRGTVAVGRSLTVAPGSWTAGSTLQYQWYRADSPIAGATAPSYTLTPADIGKSMKAAVSGSKTGHSPATRISAPTATVAPGALRGPVPTITGTARVGRSLTTDPGAWTPGTTVTYQWYRSGALIDGAVEKNYTLTTADRHASIRVRTTGAQAGYNTLTRLSRSTARISP